MELLLMILPLIVILFFLIRKKHMLLAGLFGGIVAIIISWILVAMGVLDDGILPSDVNHLILNVGLTDMLSKYLAPVIYAAGAVMIARSGSIKAFVEALNRLLKGKLSYLAAGIVLIQGLATYMAGMGAGNTMVIAPLMAAAVGFVPEVVAAMAVATAVGFTTSPSSTETAFTATAAGMDVGDFANMMLPFTIIVYVLAAVFAWWGVHRRGAVLTSQEKDEVEHDDITNLSTKELWLRVIPTITFLLLVILGGYINKLFPMPFFLPMINVIIAAILCFIFCKTSTHDISENLIDGSRFILTTLFGVGIFLGFINMVGFLGTFEQLAALVGQAPEWLVIFVACIFAFIIAIPSGAFAAGVLTLILPTLSLIPGISAFGFGLIAISVGLGTQVSPVQINVAALSDGFKKSIVDIVRNNAKFVPIAGGVVALIGLLVGFF